MQVLIQDDTRVCELPTSDDRGCSHLACWTLDKLLDLYIHFAICQMGINFTTYAIGSCEDINKTYESI